MTDNRDRQRSRDVRTPPHNLDAEASLLGAALLSADAAGALITGTETRDFYKPAHQHVADTIRRMVTAESPVDVVTVADDLRRTGLLDLCGGAEFLLDLQHATPAISNAARYAKIVRDTSTLRRLIYAATRIADAAYDEPDDPGHAINKAGDLLAELNSSKLEQLSGWDVADIGKLLDGDLQPEQPALLSRTDGGLLLYAGKVHSLQAEPSSGKSWIAIAAICEVLEVGGSAAYLDYEDTGSGITGRSLVAGASPAALRQRFDYRQLSGKFGAAERLDLFRMLDRLNPDLVIIDGVAEALSREGLSEDKADDVVRWFDLLPRPIARTGAAVLLLDHVSKDPESRGRWARGSGAKLGAIDGATYQLKVRIPFSPKRAGRVDLIIAKDRPGGVGAINEVAAEVHITPHGDGSRTVIRFDPHVVDQAPTDSWKPTILMGKLWAALSEAAVPLTTTGLLGLVHADKATTKREALSRLIAEGYVAEGTGRPRTLRVLKQWEGAPTNQAGQRLAPAWREPPPDLFHDDEHEPPPTPDELADLHRTYGNLHPED